MYEKLSKEQIIAIHDMELAQTKGLAGIKEPGYLEFISDKPFSTVFGEEQYPGLFLKAAVLMEGIIKSHCFFDANKRTGVLCTYVFLGLNGYELDADEDDLFDITIKITTNDIELEALVCWLEINSLGN